MAEIKKILQGAKNSYQDLAKEFKQPRQYIANIGQQQQQQQQCFRPKKYKKVVYEEATDSEPEPEQEETKEIEEIEEQDKQQIQEQNNKQTK